MANKSEMFKGLTATDIHPTFRTDLVTLGALSVDDASKLAQILVEDSRSVGPTSTAALANAVSQKLSVLKGQATPLARSARSFAIRIGRRDDNPASVVDDLIQMQIVSPTGRDALLKFLTVLREHRDELSGRTTRQQMISGGGYHLGGYSVFIDYRLTYDKFDLDDVSLDTYQPQVTGLVPVVTLELEIHHADEEKTFAIRLPEDDLVKMEQALKLARLQLAAAKKRVPGE